MKALHLVPIAIVSVLLLAACSGPTRSSESGAAPPPRPPAPSPVAQIAQPETPLPAATYPLTLKSSDGFENKGLLSVPEGAPRAMAIIMNHGAMGTFDGSVPAWATDRFTKEGYTVLAANRRDCCAVRNPSATLEGGLLDLQASIDYLSSLGYQKVFMAGHSGGTTYSAIFASQFPEDTRLAAIGLFGVVADTTDSARNVVQKGVYDDNLAKARQLVAEGRGQEVQEWPSAFPGRTIPATSAAWLSQWGPESKGIVTKEIAKVRVPVLLIRSETDVQFTPDAYHQQVLAAGQAARLNISYLTVPDPVKERPPQEGHSYVGVEAEAVALTLGWLKANVPSSQELARTVRRPA